jgi:hypothetical protein
LAAEDDSSYRESGISGRMNRLAITRRQTPRYLYPTSTSPNSPKMCQNVQQRKDGRANETHRVPTDNHSAEAGLRPKSSNECCAACSYRCETNNDAHCRLERQIEERASEHL